MKRMSRSIHKCASLLSAGLLAMTLATCNSTPAKTESPKLGNPVSALPTIRIKAGVDAPFKDSKGIMWEADNGSDGGQPMDRKGEITIAGTDRPELYMAEHYFDGPTGAYHVKVPNGSYVVALHFSEDYDGIAESGDRKFTYAVRDGSDSGKIVKEVKGFSPWAAAGAQFKAYVDKIPVTVTTGLITITFAEQVEHPQINAIEVTPK